MPRRYGVIDQLFITEGYIKKLPAEATKLYVFLSVVSDWEGCSWYSDSAIRRQVGLERLEEARRQLIDKKLILWHRPVYTLLEIPPHNLAMAEKTPVPTPNSEECANREEVKKIFATFRASCK